MIMCGYSFFEKVTYNSKNLGQDLEPRAQDVIWREVLH